MIWEVYLNSEYLLIWLYFVSRGHYDIKVFKAFFQQLHGKKFDIVDNTLF